MQELMMRIAKWMAILGGTVLTLLVLLTCISISGRLLNGFFHGDFMEGFAPGFAQWALALGVGPVNGDFELVEAGVAFAIFAFFPLCQITGGHASVDIVTNALSRRFNLVLLAIIDVIFAAVLILIAVQLFKGMMAKMNHHETTFLLQFPLWWAYGASFFAAAVAALIGSYVALVRFAEMLTGRVILTSSPEAGH